MRDAARGFWYGAAAYVIWGLFPLYWPLLAPTPPFQILAHRMVWSLLFVAAVLIVRRRWAFVGELRADPRRLGLLAIAGGLISINWGIYIWAVNSGHVLEASLGYFINPLVSIGLGVVVLHERLRAAQWAAVGIGFAAVLVIAVGYGHVPWIALSLAASFGTYGLVKKLARTPPVESLGVETSLMALPALVYLAIVHAQGHGAFGHLAAGTDLLLISSGIVTAIPLLFFAAAARRVPLSALGLVQYLTPVLQFLIAIVIRHENLPRSELAGFGLVWVALAILSFSQVAQWRRDRGTPAVSAEIGVPRSENAELNPVETP